MPKTTSPDRATTTAVELQFEQHRRELIAYCYRMLGSSFEAEDAVQETFVRAWRAYDSFEGRSSVRSWLYRIATNVCLDMVGSAQRRARPMEMGPSSVGPTNPGPTLPEATWIQPMPDSAVLLTQADPAELAVQRETIRLAFIAALQHQPPRQRAVLILRDVLRWRAAEVAELIGGTVASVNSALQRARATLAEIGPSTGPSRDLDEQERALVARYVAAFERYDMTSLTTLLRDDAVLSMPPYALWVQGPDEIAAWMTGPGFGCEGSRVVPAAANGSPAFGQYRCAEGGYTPWALVVLETDGTAITGINSFLDTPALFPLFGLPLRLEAGG
ncbi:MAG: sigma-70 family RNA polymerase sigma factor [Pseudonocardia sp.]